MASKSLVNAKRILSLIFSLVLVFSAAMLPNASAKTAEELRQEQQKLDEQIKANQEKINNIKNQQNKNEEQLKLLSEQSEQISKQLRILEGQATALQNEIDGFTAEINKLDEKINGTKETINKTNDEIDSTKKLIGERIKANYMAGSTSWLEMLLESDSMSTLLLRVQLLADVTEQDNDLVDHLNDETKKLEKLKKSLESDRKKTDEKRKKVESKKRELDKQAVVLSNKQSAYNANYKQISDLMTRLDRNSAACKAEIKRQTAKRDAFEAQIEAMMQEGSQGGDGSSDNYYSDGEMMWPVPYKNSYISAGYGYYDPENDGTAAFHPAIDIVVRENGRNVSYGKKIVAAQGGRVISRGYSDVGGNYVTIDHGDGYRTYYGHCSRTFVSAGQIVTKGQHIAAIGDTGYVTGPHVHFQVMRVVNGRVQKLNPLLFVKAPNG